MSRAVTAAGTYELLLHARLRRRSLRQCGMCRPRQVQRSTICGAQHGQVSSRTLGRPAASANKLRPCPRAPKCLPLSSQFICPGPAQVLTHHTPGAFPERPLTSSTYQLCGKLVHLPRAPVFSSVKWGIIIFLRLKQIIFIK